MSENDFEALLRDAMEDPTVRTASKEHSKRREMAEVFEAARRARGLSLRELAKTMRTSLSQVQRLLDRRSGDSLTLRTVINAADALALEVEINVIPRFVATAAEGASQGQWYAAPKAPPPAKVIPLTAQKREAVAETLSESSGWKTAPDDAPVAAVS